MNLPATPNYTAFDALHDDPPAWQAVITAIARRHSPAPVVQRTDGTALVALVGTELVVKLYAPFLHDHFAFERAMLPRLHGQLTLPTPQLVASGEEDGWPYLVMTQLAGTPLTARWGEMAEPDRLALLRTLGELTVQVHALPVDELAALAPSWQDFIARQRAGCLAQQQRTGLPPHLLAQLPDFLAGELPTGSDVPLTGEYTPMNLMVSGDRLAGMYDFGDGLVGPRQYDWLGPLAFLCAGHAARCEAFFAGCGARPSPAQRLGLLRLLLLHRYSNLRGQLKMADWQQAPSFEALAQRLWPLPGEG